MLKLISGNPIAALTVTIDPEILEAAKLKAKR